MKLMLDTHLLLWAASGDPRISAKTLTLISSPSATLCYSVASLWEVAIKSALARPGFSVDPRSLQRGLLDNGYREVAIIGDHVGYLEGLPPIHKDPFDRMLVAQAVAEGLVLLTSDRTMAKYGSPVRLAS